MFDDDLPAKKPGALKNLEPMSIDELNAYIGDMQAEIERVRGEIARKDAHKSAADSFFKK